MLQLFNQGSGGGVYVSAETYGITLTMTGSNSIGVYSNGDVAGVEGFATASNGTGTGVYGHADHGPGVHGESSSGSGARGDSTTGDGLRHDDGDERQLWSPRQGTVGRHRRVLHRRLWRYRGESSSSPSDGSDERVKYVCLEGPESGTISAAWRAS
jgi:hypothetical protein